MAAPSKSVRPGAARRAAHDGKVRKEFWLDPQLLSETVELALDLVAFRGELLAGAKALRGLPLSRLD